MKCLSLNQHVRDIDSYFSRILITEYRTFYRDLYWKMCSLYGKSTYRKSTYNWYKTLEISRLEVHSIMQVIKVESFHSLAVIFNSH